MRDLVSIAASAALALAPVTAGAQDSPPEAPPKTKAAAPAPDRPQKVMIVLDASGSMWAALDGKPRIVIARAALANILRDWNPKTELGLMAYGHRRKRDCNDIQTLVPVGKVPPFRIIDIVNRINPKGHTPLSEAVRRAAETLKYTEERATVILLSDGKETCNADPCAVGRMLKKTGVDFRAHVIGFALKPSEEAGLRCLANTTGGRYFRAGNADELKKALEETAKSAQEREAPETEPKQVHEATIEGPDDVQITAKFQVTWTGPNRAGDYVTIVPKDAKDGTYLSYAYTSRGSPSTLRAPDRPGAYEIRYVLSKPRTVLAAKPITVRPAESSVKAPASVGIGSSFEVEWTGPAGDGDYITVVKPDAGNRVYGSYAYTSRGSPVTLRAPETAGTYEIRYVTARSRRVLSRARIEVTPTAASLTVPEKVAIGKRFEVAFTGPGNKGDYITIVKPEAKDRQYKSYAYTSRGSPLTLRAATAPGPYEVRYVLGKSRRVIARARLTVVTVDTALTAPDSVTVGNSVEIEWTGPGARGDYITIAPPDAPDGKYLSYAYAKRNPVAVRAPDEPGRYEIRYVAGGRPKRVLGRRPLEVKEAQVTLEAPPSVKRETRFTVEWTGPKNASDYITIVEAGAKRGRYGSYGYTRKGRPIALRAPKSPGKYEIRFVMGRSKRIVARRAIVVE